jgi:hypothetical protein
MRDISRDQRSRLQALFAEVVFDFPRAVGFNRRMDFNGLSPDLLAVYEAQLRATLEMTQRLLAQVEGLRRGNPAKWLPQMMDVTASPLPPHTLPGPEASLPVPSLPPQPRPFPQQQHRPPDIPPREAVAEAVRKQTGEFGIKEVRKSIPAGRLEKIADSTMRRLLEEMRQRKEVILISHNTGRGGNKYCLPPPVPPKGKKK